METFVFIVCAVIYRLRKMALIRRTLRQDDRGFWMWEDRKGVTQTSATNPLEDMRKDGEEAHKMWHRNN